MEPIPKAQPGPFGHPLTLAELQNLANTRIPALRQAIADVEAARGAARQARVYPNPTAGYLAESVNTAGTAGYQGIFIEQLIKTGGKLKAAEAAALAEVANAEIRLNNVQADVAAKVRAAFFAVRVARFGLEVHAGIRQHTETIYELSRDYAVAGLRPSHEALGLRALVVEARGDLTKARTRYLTAWKQLALAIGDPDLPVTEVEGSPEQTAPVLQQEHVLAQLPGRHTDVRQARNGVEKARLELHQARLVPIPDVQVSLAVQKDYTSPPHILSHNVQVGVPLPIWDKNLGNIARFEAGLAKAMEQEQRVRLELEARTAEAFERYKNERLMTEYYRTRVIPDLKKVYHLVLTLYAAQSERAEYNVNFLDLINNQQLYVSAVKNYIAALSAQWQAVADVGALLQTDGDLHEAETAPSTRK